MVHIKLPELMAKAKMNQKTLSYLMGIRPATLSKMYYDEAKRIEIHQINTLCRVFNCGPDALLEYIPDNE